MKKSLMFETHVVRLVGTPDAPEWVATDVCAALGISNPSDALSRVPANEKGIASTETPGGEQTVLTLKEPGLYRLIMRSRKQEAKRFQAWTFGEVLPSIRKTGRYAVPSSPATALDVLRQQHEMQGQMIATLSEHEARLAQVEQHLKEIARTREVAKQSLLALPPASVPPPPPQTTRSMINAVVRAAAFRDHAPYAENWDVLYRAFRNRQGVDLKWRAKNLGVGPLDVAEKQGHVESLYALATELFARGNA